MEPIQITDQMSLFIVHTSVQDSSRNHSQMVNTHYKYCTAGNLHKLVENKNFSWEKKTLVDFYWCKQKMPHPQILQQKLSQLTGFTKRCHALKFRSKNFQNSLVRPKDATSPNFTVKTFTNKPQNLKFVKVFSLETFPLQGTKNVVTIMEPGELYAA